MQGQVAAALPEVDVWWQRHRAGQPVPEAPAAETLARALISALDVARASHDRISNERQPPESSAEAAARRLPQRPRASRSES